MLLLYFFAFWKDIIDNIVSYIPYYVTRTSANGSAAVSFSHKLHVPWDIGADQHYIHQSKLLTQNHVNTISEWTRSNKIMLNSAKSNYMMFTRRYGLLCTRLNLESNILEKVSATYLLGVDKWRFRLGTKYFRVVQKGIFSNILAVQIEIWSTPVWSNTPHCRSTLEPPSYPLNSFSSDVSVPLYNASHPLSVPTILLISSIL